METFVKFFAAVMALVYLTLAGLFVCGLIELILWIGRN
jgi:hypothetical protein